jgi:hypothetical protein
MEVVSPGLRQFMREQSEGVSRDWLSATRSLGGLMVMDIGPRGGGKTTKAVAVVQLYKEVEPNVRRVANVPIEGAYYVPNILKFLATKLIEEGGEKPYEIAPDGTVRIIPRKTIPTKMQVTVDETAISGLEARGSGMYSLNTYLLALSRKINVDCELISQLMSMADKRAQWLSDYYTLCESFREPGFFQYRNYDSEYHRTTTQRIWFDDARENLFPKFDTTDIPNYDELSAAFRSQYQISEDDMELYKDIRDGRKHVPASSVSEKPVETFILEKRSLRAPMGRYPGETVIVVDEKGGNHRYEVLQKDWLTEQGKYRYRLREIPDYVAQQQAMAEGGMEPIEDDGGDGLSA